MAFGYPVFLDLTGVRVLVVGGGRIAWRKAQGMAEAGALVTVVAPEIEARLVELAAETRRRRFHPADIDGHRLVITATDDEAVNAEVGASATAAGVWANSADDPENCSFILPAIARRGPLVVAVSSGGASPALASHLRDEIAATVLTPGVEDAAADLAAQRAALKEAGISTEDVEWGGRVRAALEAARRDG